MEFLDTCLLDETCLRWLFGELFVANVISIALVLLIQRRYLPHPLHKKQLQSITCCVSLIIPFIGPLFFFGYTGLLIYLARNRRFGNFREQHYPDFLDEKQLTLQQNSEGSALSRMHNNKLSGQAQLETLISLNNLSGGTVNTVNTEMLSHDSDELRLFAYGKLSQQETSLFETIHNLENRLERAIEKSNQKQLILIYKALIYHLWELIYLNLAQDDIRQFTLEKINDYIEEVTTLAPRDLGAIILHGRLCLLLKDVEQAESLFEKALALNAPANKVIPYLAEIAFLNRDFKKLRQYYQKASDQLRYIPSLVSSVNYWQAT